LAYLGRQPVVGNFVKLDAIVTSATATYNLLNGGVAYFPQTANNCIVSLNGVIQSPTSAYTISGSTIIFSDSLTASDTIDFILVLGDVLAIGTPSDGTVTNAKIAASTIDLTTKVTGTLPYTNGGTGLATLGTAGQALVVNSGATALQYSTVGATAGQVIQVLSATDATSRSTTSSSFITASNTLSVTITPSSTSNKIFIISNFNIHTTANETYAEMTIFRGSTNLNSVNSNYGMGRIWSRVDSRPVYPMAISYLDSPATTSATTYQIYFRAANTGTVYLGGLDSGSIASITCMEIKG
jgi:hypothetical protein